MSVNLVKKEKKRKKKKKNYERKDRLRSRRKSDITFRP